MDLDDLLDDVDIDSLKPKIVEKPRNDTRINSKIIVKESINKNQDNNAAKSQIVSNEIRPWLASSANVPKDTREKWTKLIKTDCDTEILSKFQPSAAYGEWDSTNQSKRGVGKCLQELVKATIAKCSLDESKAQRIMALINPVTDSENGKQLQLAFTKQLLKDLRFDITSDPNYDPVVFKNLSQALANEKN